MSSSSDWATPTVRNPLLIQAALLDRFEKATEVAIVDPNNPTSVLMEMFATYTAASISQIDDTVRPAMYPARAATSADLYKHISDFDYVDIFGTPASTQIVMIVDRDYVVKHALPVKKRDSFGNLIADDQGNVVYEEYKKITIPATTQFVVGNYTFGIHYPIDLKVHSANNNFTVEYNTDKKNPLNTLENNSLEYDFRWFDGLSLVYIKIPVYQFKMTTNEVILVPGAGFKQKISYTDNFYALRCFAEVLQNPRHDSSESDIWKKQELKLAMSGRTYSPTDPTVVFSPDLESKELAIEIPYIYFTDKLIRGNLTVQIFTTAGELNYTIPTDSTELVTIDMFSNTTDAEAISYASPFRTMPKFSAIPQETVVVGGSNGMTFEELRDRVVTGTIKSKTLQTPMDIDAYFKTQGYVTTLLKDGVTDRIFIAHAPLRNANNEIVAADTIGTVFDFSDISKYSTIRKTGTSSYTILPSTIYRYDDSKGVCYPLTDAEVAALNRMTPEELVEEFNSETYTISPFYLQINAADRYPTTISYDMTNVGIVSREYVKEREEAPYQLIMNSASFKSVSVNDEDTYRFIFKVSRTGLDDVPAIITNEDSAGQKNFRVLVGIKNDDGNFYYEEATWTGRSNDFDLFKVDITSTYKFHQANNDHTVVLNYGRDTIGRQLATDFFLKSEVRVIFLLNNNVEDLDRYVTGDSWLDTDFTSCNISGIDDFTAVTEYKLIVKFGDVIDELDQRANITFKEAEYKKHTNTEFVVVKDDIYKKDEYGNVCWQYTDSDNDGTPDEPKTIELIRLFKSGILFSLTKTTVDTVELHDKLLSNYIGCHYDDNEKQEKKIDENTTDGTYALKDAPIIPKFSISNSKSGDASTADIISRKFELADVFSAHAFSNSTNRWYTQVGSKEQGYSVYALRSKNALAWLMQDIFGIHGDTETELIKSLTECSYAVDANANPDFLETLTASVGQYIISTNDASDDPEYFVPQLTSISADATLLSRIYVMTEKGWVCIGKGSSALDIYRQSVIDMDEEKTFTVVYEEDGETKQKDLPYLAYLDYGHPQVHGYVYILEQMDKEGLFSEFDESIYASLTTRTVRGVEILDLTAREMWKFTESSDIIGELNPNKRYFTKQEIKYGDDTVTYMKLIHSISDVAEGTKLYELSEDDAAWVAEENCKWPWDVKNWFYRETAKFVRPNAENELVTDDTIIIVPKTSVALNLDLSEMHKYVAHTTEQYLFDENGDLIPDPDSTRRILYTADMIQLDAKLSKVTALDDERAYPNTIVNTLRSHFDNLGRARDNMFTNSRLFFEPTRSLGQATFSVGDNNTTTLPLDISMKFKIHVSQATANDELVVTNLKENIVSIIDNYIETHRSVNCVQISKNILSELTETVEMIDVLGINGDPTLQTMKPVDTEVVPHLGHRLTLLDDGATIDVARALDLEIVVNT